MKQFQSYRFSVAPMMEWTDRHCRVFHRLLSRRALLYTEMITTAALLHGHVDRLLGFDDVEHPVAVQLGGSEPRDLAAAARICADFGYDEINLNIGCPSERVQNGAFGACLMLEPELVGDCVAAIKASVSLPVTVKCRIGVDDQDPEEALGTLSAAIIAAGVDGIIVHARKAWLKGLSPRQNRDVPPLDYPLVHALKRTYPEIPIMINGGLVTHESMQEQLRHVDGVMVGRQAYQEPAMLLSVDPLFFGEEAPLTDATDVVEAFIPYVEARRAEGVPLHSMTRHILGLFNGRPGARAFRRHLATEGLARDAGADVLRAAAAHVVKARSFRPVEAVSG
ncbi:tRNA dihydrouridine(20/20a) synthase DusA [Beijerinckia indica]|uniref:tRNA-dihydrouridine(20/20a) synthase n=1 Tax=Beijerinckia indica subsp. indica (strain ATCC 9039 / DSM 1715 / NCIMB 8712) TaxID=395963 RepID=B2II58_BEII9|nr:tRNA dihydrouridine(20/20a) synthase DusA [Beijerinckia indica]ACB94641.1 TIM-barrel protein, yjbN family [Beijerinckia indica subsp. indica ATCC 9039]